MTKREVGQAVLKRGGQRKDVPPAGAAAKIQKLASTGYTKRGIAYRLGCGPTVFNRWLTEHPELQEAFDEGREREHNALYTVLFDKATKKGDTIAAMFLMKTRHGYREGDQSQQTNQVAITFNLPGAMRFQDFMTIDERHDNPQPLPGTRPLPARRG